MGQRLHVWLSLGLMKMSELTLVEVACIALLSAIDRLLGLLLAYGDSAGRS